MVLDLEPSREQRHRRQAYYLASVTMIDEKDQEILNALEKHGYLENGIVVFCSDHGDCLTDHGHSQKWTMYRSSPECPWWFGLREDLRAVVRSKGFASTWTSVPL